MWFRILELSCTCDSQDEIKARVIIPSGLASGVFEKYILAIEICIFALPQDLSHSEQGSTFYFISGMTLLKNIYISEISLHLLNAPFAQLQHGQVVVSFSVVVVKSQGKFEALVGQRQVCYAL